MVMNQSVVTTIDTWLPGRIPVLLPWVLLLSFLMVSRIRFHGVPPLTPRAFRTQPLRPSLFLLSLLLILTLQEVGLFVSFVGYLAMELGEALLRFIQAVRNPEQDLQTL
jgi:phosphatidylserine synthase